MPETLVRTGPGPGYWVHQCTLENYEGDLWAFIWRCEKDGKYAVSIGERWDEAFYEEMHVFDASSVDECITIAGDLLEGFEESDPEWEYSYDDGPFPAEYGMWRDFSPWAKERIVSVECRRGQIDIRVTRVR